MDGAYKEVNKKAKVSDKTQIRPPSIHHTKKLTVRPHQKIVHFDGV